VNNIRKSKTNVLAAAVAVSIATLAVWQFSLLVMSRGSHGIGDASIGTHHLWWVVCAELMACVVSFYAISALSRRDKRSGPTVT
jgi:hypothetical protein